MNDDLVKKNYLKKIQKIQKLNKAFYQKNNPAISDQEYDLLKKQVIDLESKYPFLKSKFSPSISVGFKPSKNFQKVKHKIPMLSLGNAFNEEDLKNFEKKNN
jgi:DNA ligase (NAD+)